MLPARRILLASDFSRCASQASSWASELASHFEAELHVLHAVRRPHGYVGLDQAPTASRFRGMEETLERTASEQLSALVRGLSGPKATYTIVRSGASPALVIMDVARERDADLVVVGTHGHRGREHRVLGSVAEELARRSPCALLTVREQDVAAAISDAVRILVPIDFSSHSRDALTSAKELASSFGASLQLLHVVQQQRYPEFYALKPVAFGELLPEIRVRAEEQMERLMSEAPGPDVAFECTVLEGQASAEILDFATRETSDLIVIPTHGVTGLERFFLGSVTEKVVRRARCPVFTIRSFRKSLIANADAVEDALEPGRDWAGH